MSTRFGLNTGCDNKRWLDEATLVLLAAETNVYLRRQQLRLYMYTSTTTLCIIVYFGRECATVTLLYCRVVISTYLFGCVLCCFLLAQQ
jgi:hypothetical protein